MRARILLAFLAALTVPGIAAAQHAASRQPIPTVPAEARQHDFLIGQWELVVKVPATSLAAKIHGAPRLVGTWKAWRAFDGFGLEDELRVTDEAGNPLALTHSMRFYDRASANWSLSTLDVYRGRFTTAAAEWKNGTMTVTSQGTDPDGKPYVARSRFFDITPGTFRYQQDRSYDDGKTWSEGTLRIEAKKVAAVAPR